LVTVISSHNGNDWNLQEFPTFSFCVNVSKL
jgi:hypothetical protein